MNLKDLYSHIPPPGSSQKIVTEGSLQNSDNVFLLCFGSASLHGSTYFCPICKRFPISTLEPCQAGKLFQHLAKLFSASFQNPPFSESSQIDMNSCPTHREQYYVFINASSPTANNSVGHNADRANFAVRERPPQANVKNSCILLHRPH